MSALGPMPKARSTIRASHQGDQFLAAQAITEFLETNHGGINGSVAKIPVGWRGPVLSGITRADLRD
ncbi:hypothetical protein, partial [Paenochrobactrum gallinarii]|uniref:hypothetical protein n=1 Tax=Paenochrobactrum gallinarii TaxID=643673 RepID=UPI0035BBE4EB